MSLAYIDLYLIHWPRGNAIVEKEGKQYLDTWRTFEKLCTDKVRAIGVSNFKEHHLKDILAMCTVTPMVKQVKLYPLNSQPDLRRFCTTHSIYVEARSPLRLGKCVVKLLLVALPQKYVKTLNQVILRWHLQRENVPIPMSRTNRKRIASDAAAFDFQLTAYELAQMEALNTNMRNCPDPKDVDF